MARRIDDIVAGLASGTAGIQSCHRLPDGPERCTLTNHTAGVPSCKHCSTSTSYLSTSISDMLPPHLQLPHPIPCGRAGRQQPFRWDSILSAFSCGRRTSYSNDKGAPKPARSASSLPGHEPKLTPKSLSWNNGLLLSRPVFVILHCRYHSF